jgi:uncharacterized protein (DUF433 family)
LAQLDRSTTLLGKGLYSVADAARLTGVSTGRIHRWLEGYSYAVGGEQHHSDPVFPHDLPLIQDRRALSFQDLLEVRFIDAFRKHGLSWKTIRLSAQRASEILSTNHPFSTKKFQTDGKTILAELGIENRAPDLLDLVRNQYAMKPVLFRYLYAGLDFVADDTVARWWPLPRKRSVVIDPQRSFGQPIVATEGVPTQILARAYEVERSEQFVASLYEVSLRSVRDALEYEGLLAA